jgi:hypothetical protein
LCVYRWHANQRRNEIQGCGIRALYKHCTHSVPVRVEFNFTLKLFHHEIHSILKPKEYFPLFSSGPLVVLSGSEYQYYKEYFNIENGGSTLPQSQQNFTKLYGITSHKRVGRIFIAIFAILYLSILLHSCNTIHIKFCIKFLFYISVCCAALC